VTVIRAGSATDVGRVREINEDRLLVLDGLFAVADGVGGHQAGEVAAQTAVETLADAFTDHTTEGLVSALEQANLAVRNLAQGHPDRRGMGTTMTAVALVEEEGEERLAVANVGDSRVYLLQRGDLVQVTEDHSLVEELVRDGQMTHEEAIVHPQRSVITRALGLEDDVEVDSWQLVPYQGDRLLLCSDGLTNELGDDDIATVLRHHDDATATARELVRRARDHGGNDNVTVVVIDIVDDGGLAGEASEKLAGEPLETMPAVAGVGAPSTANPWEASAEPVRRPISRPASIDPPAAPPVPHRRVTWRVVAFVVALIGVVAGSLGAVAWYARSTYFVGVDGGTVAIFKGRPGGLLWFRPTLQEHKSLLLADVPEAYKKAVMDGKDEPTKKAADRYVNNLRLQAVPTTTTTLPPPSTTP